MPGNNVDANYAAPTEPFQRDVCRATLAADSIPLARLGRILVVGGGHLSRLGKSDHFAVEAVDQAHFNQFLRLSGFAQLHLQDDILEHLKVADTGTMSIITDAFGNQCLVLVRRQGSCT